MNGNFLPVGTFFCDQKYRFETPRQGAFAENTGFIELREDPFLLDACRDLSGVERIWILFCFHLNESWHPFVQPPISPGGRRIGVFATRAPYRPNPIGMSCVELIEIQKRKIFVRNHDLLDGTPVLDIKPYIPAADSFPDSKVGWLDAAEKESWRISVPDEIRFQAEWLIGHHAPDLLNFCSVQLSVDPFNGKRKRIVFRSDGTYEIACRTWRIFYVPIREERTIRILRFGTGYSEEDLSPEKKDPYLDKEIHREFLRTFSLRN